MKKHLQFVIVIMLLLGSCKQEAPSVSGFELRKEGSELLLKSLKNLSDIIVHDIFSPPVASRIYVYPCVAAYEILALHNSDYKLLAGQLKELDTIPSPENNISPALSAIFAFNEVGKSLIFSEDKMESYKTELNAAIDTIGFSSEIISNSEAYGRRVADFILAWADKDNYKQSRSLPKHPISDQEAAWKPTPPAYMEGIEPHWKVIRPMVLESSSQFQPKSPVEFDMTKGSEFYQNTKVVYDAIVNATDEHKLIASFWDCNPYVMNQTGHVMIATKKITPGGHWMGIASISARQANSDMMETAEILALTSIALFDGFISCWDEKYRSNLVRPETVINEYMDDKWQPILQTPPFPEHTSGHSVISNASAVALTHIFGDTFSFSDDVEVEYGLPIRKFNSFIEAAEEAAISRLYGGIHYMPAIEDGVVQGRQLGSYIVENIKTRNTNTSN